jgi:alanyl-tRNA synthetase
MILIAWKCGIRLVHVVVQLMGPTFPELIKNEEKIKEIIAEEEASFGRTLLKVLNLFVMVFEGESSVNLS